MRMEMKNDPGIKLTIILILAAVLRFLGLSVKQLWLDEILQVLHSRPDTIRGILEAVTQDRGGAPLDYFIQHVFITHLSGPVEWTARLHAAIFGVLAVWLVYLVCRELFASQRMALMSALLFCFYPFHHHYSQEGRPYSLFILLTLILYLILFRSLKKNSWLIWISFAVVAILGFYTNAFTAAVLFAQFVFLIYYQIYRRESWTDSWRRYTCFISCSIIAAAAYLPWLLYSFSNAQGTKGDEPEFGFRLISGTIKEFGDGSYPLSLVLIIGASAGIISLLQTQRRFELGTLLIWIIAPLPVVFTVLWWRTYFFIPRQIIFITPAFFILVAAGIECFKQKFSRRYFYVPEASIILISLVVIALHYPARWDDRDDLRAVGQFLKESARPGDLIIAPDRTGILAFYFPDIEQYAADTRSALDLMRTVPAGSRIIYTAPKFNPDTDRLKILLAGMRTADEVKFQGITVYFLQKPL